MSTLPLTLSDRLFSLGTGGTSSTSPESSGSAQNGYSDQDGQTQSNLKSGSGILGSLGLLKLGRKDGEQKKRGPKPDTRPPQNPKQARNRQAQRTHRERKERYVKALEQEVVILRDAFARTVQEKNTIEAENVQLRQIILSNGLTIPSASTMTGGLLPNVPVLSGMVDFPADPNTTMPATLPETAMPELPMPVPSTATPQPLAPALVGRMNAYSPDASKLAKKYSRVGLEFVLELERPCLEHFHPRTMDQLHDSHGHALLNSLAPSTVPKQEPADNWNQEGINLDSEEVHALFNVQLADARRQDDLNKLDGEWTPFASWAYILNSKYFEELNPADIQDICKQLSSRVRCYGFGAVVEDYDVKEALANVLYKKGILALPLEQ